MRAVYSIVVNFQPRVQEKNNQKYNFDNPYFDFFEPRLLYV